VNSSKTVSKHSANIKLMRFSKPKDKAEGFKRTASIVKMTIGLQVQSTATSVTIA
jgi:hypothetical protein